MRVELSKVDVSLSGQALDTWSVNFVGELVSLICDYADEDDAMRSAKKWGIPNNSEKRFFSLNIVQRHNGLRL